MVKGYIGEIEMHTSNLERSSEAVSAKLGEGVKDEASLKPATEALIKTIDNYQNGIKSVKSAYVSGVVVHQHVTFPGI